MTGNRRDCFYLFSGGNMKKLSLLFILLFFLATSAFAQVNLNTATAEELATLPGIGQVKAEAIVKDRKANGNYKKIEDLTRVKGIGEKIVLKLKKEATLGSGKK